MCACTYVSAGFHEHGAAVAQHVREFECVRMFVRVCVYVRICLQQLFTPSQQLLLSMCAGESVYGCVYMCVCVCTSAHFHAHTVAIAQHVCACESVYGCMCVCVCVYAHMYLQKFFTLKQQLLLSMCLHVKVCMCVCVCVCVYVHMHLQQLFTLTQKPLFSIFTFSELYMFSKVLVWSSHIANQVGS